MARTKGMLNLSGNLEVNAQAPLDARTIVPTEADLTVASNFPYPYIGLEVYVTGTGKKFRLVNLDTTQSSSWHEVGEGGGGSGLPSGGTAGQYLVKQSATEGDADWQSLSAFTGATSQAAGAAGLVPAPSVGDESKVLFGNGLWGALPSVDLSVLSNEAFIFSETEKPVGMWTDRKILYAKTVDISSLLAAINNDTSEWKSMSHGISNIDTIVDGFFKARNSAGSTINFSYGYTHNNIDYLAPCQFKKTEIMAWNCRGAVNGFTTGEVTLFYTKTTDSPLASDEKFAGVTSGGEVILEKTISSNSYWNLPSNTWTSTGVSMSNVSIIDCKALRLERFIGSISAWADNGILKLLSVRQTGDEVDTVTIRYTKTS